MKLFLLSLAAVTILTGCVGYAAPYPNAPVYGNAPVYRSDEGHHRHYDRDRDGDGIPDRRDRRPDNPYRY
jgi:hypothetical protein